MRGVCAPLGFIALLMTAVGPIACAPMDQPIRRPAPAPIADPGPSIFAYPWVWTDDRGEQVAFSRWRGESLVVSAIYVRCKSTCPRTIGKLQEITDNFRQQRSPAQFFLVTLDPTSDTPADLRQLKATAGFPENWHLLAGSVEETRELADLLDIHVIDDGPHLMHDARIVVFDGEGRRQRAFGGWALQDEGSSR